MTQTLNRHGQRLVILPPFGVWVVVIAAIGMMIVVAPRELVEAAGLLALRQAHDNAFGVLVLLLTTWASWIVAGQLATYHSRSVLLKRIPDTFDKLSTSERHFILACLEHGSVVHRNAYDSIARSLCELGFLTPPLADSHDPLRLDVTYSIPSDVANVLRAHLACRPLRPSSAPRL
jgi:hypothetical protein